MKKIFIAAATLFAVLIPLSIFAESSSSPASLDVLPIERLIKERSTGDLDDMIKRRIIRIVVSYSKTFYYYDVMQPKGPTYDMMQEFEKFVNLKLNTGNQRIYVVFVPVPRDQIIASLQDGRGDIAAASLTITPERQKEVEFSVPAMENIQELVVTGPAAPNIATLNDLAGREVFVRKSSSYYEHLLKLNDAFNKAGKKSVVIRLADENLEDEDIMEMVDAGLIGITAIDSHLIKIWAGFFNNLAVHQDMAINSGGQIAWAFRKGNPKLKDVINDFVSTHRLGTPYGNALAGKYFGSGKRLKNVAAGKEMEKFEVLKDIFKKYGDLYNLDWILLAAQGYNESGLNQNARSRRGAVGIMQLLPSTAASSPINISDIRTPESNIHAGAKLLRFFIDNYFNDSQINKFNRGLFTVASYNAGPEAIAKVRKKASEMGLNDDKWFQNVEVAAAHYIGQETVQYVSNVYKYYICYRMALEREREKQAAEKSK